MTFAVSHGGSVPAAFWWYGLDHKKAQFRWMRPVVPLTRKVAISGALLALSAALFVVRGPLRAADPIVNLDAPLLLAASKTWLAGGNPYDPSAIAATFHEQSEAVAATLRRGQQAFVYSPPAYMMLSPLTLLPWKAALATWNLLNTVMYVAALLLICRLSRLRLDSVEGLALMTIGLAGNPGHICIALGQTGVLTLFLMCVSWCLFDPAAARGMARHPIASGLAATAALMVKPQITLAYLCYDLYRGRRISCAVALLAAVIAMIAVLAWHGDAWVVLQSWFANMKALLHADADPLFGSLPHQLINLQSPLAVLTGNRGVASALTIGICAALAVAYLWASRGHGAGSNEDLGERAGLSAVTLLMLLFFYHRLYDGVFLMLPAAFALRLIGTGDRRGWILLALFLPLWIPMASIVHRSLALEGSFSAGPLVQALIVQHQTWFLVGAFLFLCNLRRSLPETAEQGGGSTGPIEAVILEKA